MKIPVNVKLPDLWADGDFEKSEWGYVNYLVGPNGTGKTRFADQLTTSLKKSKFKPRYLSAERLAGLEKQALWGRSGPLGSGFDVGNYTQYQAYGADQGLAADAFVTLKLKLDVRIRIEAFLSSMFARRIRFAEEGGYLKPKIQKTLGGTEYEMKSSECHGLKELITLLTFLYDDAFDALIIDEPELHLHPQFQSFFLAEVRRASGDPKTTPGTKVFFLITHSPYLLDFRTIDELQHCLIFHTGKKPSSIGIIEGQDEYWLKRLLPRLNTHHKQFFFATRPIFVEGYSDQQLFALVQDSRGKLLGATGAAFIDVNGKGEQDFFFRLCSHLKIDAQFVADLDVLTRGDLRNSISEDDRCKKFVTENAIGIDLMDAIRQLNLTIDALIRRIESSTEQALEEIQAAIAQPNETESKRYRTLMAVIHESSVLKASLSGCTEVDYIFSKTERLRDACRAARVFLLPKGALENHIPSYAGSKLVQIADRAKFPTFETERDFILAQPSLDEIERRYSSLIPLLDEASGAASVDLKQHLGYAIGVLIGTIQVAFERREIISEETLKEHASVDFTTFGQIVDLVSFSVKDRTFVCRMKLKRKVDSKETEFEFTDSTSHSKFTLPDLITTS